MNILFKCKNQKPYNLKTNQQYPSRFPKLRWNRLSKKKPKI